MTISTQTYCYFSNICAYFIPPVPEEAPAFLQGYPVNATSIRIFWKALPPSRHKEQLLGYRVKYRRLGTQLYNQVNVTSNFTEAFLKVVPQTRYEIEVNGFNEIGLGPASEVLLVKSLSNGRLEIPSCCLQRLPYCACNGLWIVLMFLK